MRKILEGKPDLGANWEGSGTNFGLFSANATKVELCLFDDAGKHEIERVTLPEYTNQVWHGYLRDVRPGQLYGYRVHGPYEPYNGHRFNANKLLIDPYAKALKGNLRWHDACFGYKIGSPKEDLAMDKRDNAAYMPKCRVTDPAFTWGNDRQLDRKWTDTIIYEAHVKGFTQLHPDVPPNLRGTFAGLAHPEVVDYLVKLGVTAIELLPVHGFVQDHFLVQKGLSNYWGYNSINFFAPETRYLAQNNINEFRTCVKNLHEAGIEVILDVVYNHTAEGNHMGPTFSFRGIDNASYYRLSPEDARFYYDTTGCGNTLNLAHPRVLQMVMDSLRYWVTEMHIDGFRFDLASTLGREGGHDFDSWSGFFDVIRQDPVLSKVKMIAEPWDLGDGGYQVGGFPPGWSEWNDKYRDTVREYWKGDEGKLADLAFRLAGSSDLYNNQGRKPRSSINFITAHDGFTLHDLVSYNEPHNEANQEEGGHSDNKSWNCGEEGETENPEVNTLRAKQKRNMLATLILSQGVPMLLGGDETSRTQGGNNNAYCQDSEIGWTHWDKLDNDLFKFTQEVIALRKNHEVFRRKDFFNGQEISEGLRDLMWFTPAGTEMEEGHWNEGYAKTVGMQLASPKERFIILLNAYHEDIDFKLPEGVKWRLRLDTTQSDDYDSSETYKLKSRSLAVLEAK